MPDGLPKAPLLALGTVLLLAGAFLVLRGGAALPPMPTEEPMAPVSRRAPPHPAELRPASREAVAAPKAEPATDGSEVAVPKARGRVEIDGGLQQILELERFGGKWVEASGASDSLQLEGSGTLRVTWPDGTPMVEGRFVDGKREGTWTRWHADGRFASKAGYLRGVPHGEWLQYHPSGMIAERKSYENGRAEGPATAWHENGQIREQGAWTAGKRHGTWTWFDEQGRLVREERWNAGARVGPIAMFEPGAEPKVERERERRAAVGGRYSHLLRRIAAPEDKAQYGEFHDYGHYQPIAEYQGEAAVPEGYWVYVHPYWYIWGRRGGEGR